jgi:hypothetical protein
LERYTVISPAPIWLMPQQQRQHVIRPVWRQILIIDCLYPNSSTPVNSDVVVKANLPAWARDNSGASA